MFVQRLPHPFGVLATVAFPEGESRRGRTSFARPSPSREVRNPSEGSEVDASPPHDGLHPEALRATLAQLGADPATPVLATPRGAPRLPAGFVGSITHKPGLAAALAARADEPLRTLGLDLEIAAPLRTDIGSRILTARELTALAHLTGAARDFEVLRWFAAKEAIYKALDPWVSRYVAFREATVTRAPDGTLSATLALPPAEGTFQVELHDGTADDLILIAARIAR